MGVSPSMIWRSVSVSFVAPTLEAKGCLSLSSTWAPACLGWLCRWGLDINGTSWPSVVWRMLVTLHGWSWGNPGGRRCLSAGCWTESADPPSLLKMSQSHSRSFRSRFFSLKHLVVLMQEIKLQGPHDKLARCPSATLVYEVPVKSGPWAELNKVQFWTKFSSHFLIWDMHAATGARYVWSMCSSLGQHLP